MNKNLNFILSLSLLLFITAIDANGQDSDKKHEFNIKPAVLTDVDKRLVLGGKFDFKYKLLNHELLAENRGFVNSAKFDIDFESAGSAITRPELSTEEQKAELKIGILSDFLKDQQYYGAFFTGLRIFYEADQSFHEQHAAGGLEVRYTNNDRIFLFIPDVSASYNFVKPIRSDIREMVGEENDHYQRLDIKAWFNWNLSSHLLLSPQIRYFNSKNLNPLLAEQNLDQGLYGSIILGLALDKTDKRLLKHLGLLYLQYNRGQLPVFENDRQTLEFGLAFIF